MRHTRASAEFGLQTEQAGRSMAEWLRQRAPDDDRVAAVHSGATARDALLAMAFGWCENMVQAAVKAVPLGQSAGQRLLAALAQSIPAAVDDALARDDDTRQAFTPLLSILSARHETQYSRLFRS